jgi:hypothetical protein
LSVCTLAIKITYLCIFHGDYQFEPITEHRGLNLLKDTFLRVFENRVLRRIFGLKRDEVTGG